MDKVEVKKIGRPRLHEDIRKYNRDYYHSHKTPSKCEYCEKSFACLSSLQRHQQRSSKCMMQKLTKHIAKIEERLLDQDLLKLEMT